MSNPIFLIFEGVHGTITINFHLISSITDNGIEMNNGTKFEFDKAVGTRIIEHLKFLTEMRAI